MRETTYLSACEFGGAWFDPGASAIRSGSINDVPARDQQAVYIICDWPGRVLYVGSTTIGVRNRVRQHLADAVKTREWSTVWTVPIKSEAPLAELRRIEALICTALRPLQNKFCGLRALSGVRNAGPNHVMK